MRWMPGRPRSGGEQIRRNGQADSAERGWRMTISMSRPSALSSRKRRSSEYSRTVDILIELRSPFDETAIGGISVPARWPGDTPDNTEVVSKGNDVSVGDVCLRYNRTGLHRVLPG